MNTADLKKNPLAGTIKLTRTKELVLCAMFTVLVFVFTNLNVPFGLPGAGGLVHLGNIPFFLGAILFGKKIGALSAGIGMALFDMLSPYAAWAPTTFLTGLATGYMIGLITEKKKTMTFIILAIVAAAVVKVSGYYIGEGIMFGNWIAPATSIPANISQVVVAAVVVLVIIKPLQVAAQKIFVS